MPPLQAAGFVVVIFAAATMAGMLSHYGILEDGHCLPGNAQIVVWITMPLFSIGAFLATRFGVQRR